MLCKGLITTSFRSNFLYQVTCVNQDLYIYIIGAVHVSVHVSNIVFIINHCKLIVNTNTICITDYMLSASHKSQPTLLTFLTGGTHLPSGKPMGETHNCLYPVTIQFSCTGRLGKGRDLGEK